MSSISSSFLIYGGLLIITSYLSFILSNKSLLIILTSRLSLSLFLLATIKALPLISLNVTLLLGNTLLSFNPIAPLPVHKSKISILWSLKWLLIKSIILETSSSVSNLGINTSLLTIKSKP